MISQFPCQTLHFCTNIAGSFVGLSLDACAMASLPVARWLGISVPIACITTLLPVPVSAPII